MFHAPVLHFVIQSTAMQTVSVRLSESEAAILRDRSRGTSATKSAVIRELIRNLPRRRGKRPDPYERALPFIGAAGSGGLNLSQSTGEKFYQMLLEEKRARDARGRRSARRTRRS